MKLTKFKVTNFRSVKDSGWIETENITTLVGVNESGKSNILLALWKLNPASRGDIAPLEDMPISKLAEYRSKPDAVEFVSAIFLCSDEEVSRFRDKLEVESELDTQYQVTRFYDGRYSFKYTKRDELDDEKREILENLIIENIPHFIYYSNYGNLSGRVYLPHAIEWLAGKTVRGIERNENQVRTLQVLFEFVNLNPSEILELGRHNIPNAQVNASSQFYESEYSKVYERIALLQSASTELTQSFKSWWKQGNYRFRLEADGEYFSLLVADELRSAEVSLTLRSTGLQWFLSFFLVFLVERRNSHRNCVLLLDEAGLTLHPSSQKDLASFFESLSIDNQIIHTTHSPFLVNPSHIERCRVVAVDNEGYTYVSSDLRVVEKDKKLQPAAYALHAALGLGVSDVFLHGCQIVVVEGVSDQYYMNAIKLYLLKSGNLKFSKEIVFIPSGGVRNVSALASLVGGKTSGLPHVILDADASGAAFKSKLAKELYSGEPAKLHSVGDFVKIANSEIEDIIPVSLIGKAVHSFLRTDDEEEFVPCEGKPIVPQIEEYALANDIHLPSGWKVEVAKKIKAILERTNGREMDSKYVDVWQNIFSALASDM